MYFKILYTYFGIYMLKILCSSSTNDSDDDSSEDLIWNSYRKQIKSQSSNSSIDKQENLDTTVPSCSDQGTNVHPVPLADVQSWTEMLHSVTSIQQSVPDVLVSSSSELDDKTASDLSSQGGSQDILSTVKKVGKKAKVRKHAKKKKTQASKDEKKEVTSKNNQKDSTEEQLQDSKLCNEIKSEDNSNAGNIPDDKVRLTEYHDQAEDINVIKMRLEAQISARKGFGVLPSQEVVYDKVCVMLYTISLSMIVLIVEIDPKKWLSKFALLRNQP